MLVIDNLFFSFLRYFENLKKPCYRPCFNIFLLGLVRTLNNLKVRSAINHSGSNVKHFFWLHDFLLPGSWYKFLWCGTLEISVSDTCFLIILCFAIPFLVILIFLFLLLRFPRVCFSFCSKWISSFLSVSFLLNSSPLIFIKWQLVLVTDVWFGSEPGPENYSGFGSDQRSASGSGTEKLSGFWSDRIYVGPVHTSVRPFSDRFFLFTSIHLFTLFVGAMVFLITGYCSVG